MKILCHVDAISDSPKLSQENRGGANVPSEALNPLPLGVTNEVSTTSFVSSNRCIGIKFEPTQKGFAPTITDPSSRRMSRWLGFKEMVLKSFGNTVFQQVRVRLFELHSHLLLSQMDQRPKRKRRY
ncbi:hypothetical protein ACB092_01G192400 [Castanea dentata]